MKQINDEIKYQKEETYQKALSEIADDFNRGLLTFQEHEKAKKELHKDIFGY